MQTAFFQRGDINNLGPAQEVQLAFKFFLHAASFVIVQAVPLVDTDHQGTTAFENVARNVGILFGNTGVRIEKKHNHVGAFDCLKRFNHRELFDCLKHFAFTAKAGGIDQGVITIFILELDLDRIASGSGHVKSNQTIFTDQSIDQRALACVRTARNGNFNLMFEILFLIDFLFGRERFQNKVHQGFDPFAVGGGDGVRLAQGQFIELGLSRFR